VSYQSLLTLCHLNQFVDDDDDDDDDEIKARHSKVGSGESTSRSPLAKAN